MGTESPNTIEIDSDASSATVISNLVGSSKVRHVEVIQLRLQKEVRKKIIVVNKESTDDNLADAVTKKLDAPANQKHLEGGSHKIGSELGNRVGAAEKEVEGA